MKKVILIAVAIIATATMSSCLGELQEAASIYQSVKAANEGYHSLRMVNSMKHAIPIFKDYSCVKVQTLILAGQNAKAQELRNAFTDNLRYLVREYLKAAQLENIGICENNCDSCKGKTLTIQFIENGYEPNLLNKLTMGGMLRGKLRYIDQSGKIIREEDMEVAKNYRDLLQEIALSIGSKAGQTAFALYPDKDPQKIVEKLNQVKPIKPEYEKLFEQN